MCCITAMMHSEEVKDHEKALIIMDRAKAEGLKDLSIWQNSQVMSLLEHKAYYYVLH